MTKINLNKVAQAVAKREGKKQQVNIAQIKEIIGCFIDELLWNYDYSEIIDMFERSE